jgi:hypothetical protein
MYRYHVTINDDKRVITADSKSRPGLERLIANEFKLTAVSSPMQFQYWEAEFEDWVTTDDTDTLPDKCKLKVLFPAPAPSTPVNSLQNPDLSSPLFPMSSSPLATSSLENGSQSPYSTPVSASQHKTWPLVYTLPPIPRRIHADLVAAKSIIEVNLTTQHLLIRVLYEDMIQYGW